MLIKRCMPLPLGRSANKRAEKKRARAIVSEGKAENGILNKALACH